ncbi:metal-dependent regulator [Lapidilactobacillus concavus DSM 17758]|uniref:Manganese transport regulator n=1 Tax=Lapidilactobacillus concavus DSM 17758 TaxID=1423735 RepID=A0A0R1VPM9_9LACO|nr:metal-dependent transcriptional regulator [Lapidilactobacillus concavus]KRM07792.1 metal-dependent regulator [Lapidilactobacillus concavus DSM 17758]GEL13598.1 Cro/Cl family transcriptional regulator [Lapidilactobacillus concavus]
MSPNQENYLKAIYELRHDQRKITNKNIADILQVSAPSVTEMLTSLAKEELVRHTPYNEISLTEKGTTIATNLVRRHRIWEVFLHDKLNYNISEVHEAADVLEHATDGMLVQRLNDFLDQPERCPHGGLIPGNAPLTDQSDQVLVEMPDNSVVQLKRVIDNHEFLMYFEGLHLPLGSQLIVKRHEPFEGPIIVETTNHEELAISYKAASYMFVDLDEVNA